MLKWNIMKIIFFSTYIVCRRPRPSDGANHLLSCWILFDWCCNICNSSDHRCSLPSRSDGHVSGPLPHIRRQESLYSSAERDLKDVEQNWIRQWCKRNIYLISVMNESNMWMRNCVLIIGCPISCMMKKTILYINATLIYIPSRTRVVLRVITLTVL